MSEKGETPNPAEHALVQRSESTLPPPIAKLREEIARLSASDRLELEMNFTEHETAQERLDRLARNVERLAHLTAQISLELYQQQPTVFQELLVSINQTLSSIDIELVTFEAAVAAQYPQATLMQKFIISLLALTRGVSDTTTLMNVLGNNERTRQNLLAAKNGLSDILSGKREKVVGVVKQITSEQEAMRERKIQEILREDPRYQELVAEQRELNGDLYNCDNAIYHWYNPNRSPIQALRTKYNLPLWNNELDTLTAFKTFQRETVNAIKARSLSVSTKMAAIENAAASNIENGAKEV